MPHLPTLLLALGIFVLAPLPPVEAKAQRVATTSSTKKNTSAPQKRKSKSAPATARKKTPSSRPRKTAAPPATEGIRKLQTEQAQLKKQLEASRSELRTTKNSVRSELASLQLLNGRISDQERIVKGIRNEVDTLDRHIGVRETELRALEADLAACKRKYTRGVIYMHRNRMTHNKLMFLFSAASFRQMYRRLRYVQSYTHYQRAQGTIVREKEEQVRAKRNELAAVRSSKHVLLCQGQAQQTKLEGQQKEQQQMVDRLSRKEQELRATIARQQRQYNALNTRIDQLIQAEIAAAERRRKAEEERRRKEEQRRQEAARAKAREEAKAAARTAREGSAAAAKRSSKHAAPSAPADLPPAPSRTPAPDFRAPDDTDRRLSSNFAANQGRLPVPITGSYVISSRFGAYNVEGLRGVTLDNKGINLTGAGGAQARCVFDGEVTAIFPMGGMMNVIVRHGSYISVYCNLAGVAVRQGQRVATRQTLGPVARDASGHCTLHFQLRRETTKLNPERWIAR